jgi:SAM-dependent methyltransferase
MPTRPRRERRNRGGADRSPIAPDRLLLYTPAVQHVEHDLDVLERIYRNRNGRAPVLLREDFCGTAALASEWVRRGSRRRAWGLDLHGATLAWARRRRLPALGPAAERITLVQADARRVTRPPADLVVALNYSYWVFHRRAELRAYFRAARASLAPGGLLCLDAFGGTGAMEALVETRHVPASRGPGGQRVPAFRYVWEQAAFNPVDHRLSCRIHIRLRDGRELRRAFAYDWRMWTLPEIRELLAEAGFRESIVYLQDWDDEGHRALGSYSRRRRFDNQLTWLVYVVGVR